MTDEPDKTLIIEMRKPPTDKPWKVIFVGFWTPQEIHMARLAISNEYKIKHREFLYSEKRMKQRAKSNLDEQKVHAREEKELERNKQSQEISPETDDSNKVESLTVKDSTLT